MLYPFRDLLELRSLGDFLQNLLPAGAKGFVAMIRYWHLTLFYLFAELWGNIVLNMLFWGFVNEVTVFSDAKKFYSLFALSGVVAPIFSSRFCLSFKGQDWDDSLKFFMSSVIVSGCVVLLLFYLLNRALSKKGGQGLFGSRPVPRHDEVEEKGFSLRESIQLVRGSKHLSCVMILVLGYYMVYNFMDVLWSDQLGQRFKEDTAALNAYLNQVSMFKGLVASFLALVVSGKVIQKFGWHAAAMITPVLLGVTGLLFFLCLLLDQGFLGDILLGLFSAPFLHVVVLIGSIQHCLVRASKYAVFDATKEMAFIPLSRQHQRMGKAVVDGIGARIGKAGGSLVFQFLLYFLGSLSATAPYIAAMTAVILVVWVFAIGRLKKEIEGELNETV